jgi:UDP-3-O-[3-hydroxymyristoyl] glucosamine N-acyltransferase
MINDTSKPLIFLGSSQGISIYIECCESIGIEVAGIIDNDYYGNTATIEHIPVIDGNGAFLDVEKIAYYRENFNFFCAVNWLPMQDEISTRNRKKRQDFISLTQQHNLSVISLVDPRAMISKSASIGHGCFVGGLSVVEPHAKLEDFSTVWYNTGIAHNSVVGFNSILQRWVGMVGHAQIKDNVYMSPYSVLLKSNIVVNSNAWIQPGIMVLRDVAENEIVAINGKNTRRIYTIGSCVD